MITYKVREPYTAEVDFPLTDKRCDRSLNEFGMWDWSGDFSYTISCSDKYILSRTLVFKEETGVSDFLYKSVVIKAHDGISLKDGITHSLEKLFFEKAIYRDTVRKTFSKKLYDRASTADGMYKSGIILVKDGVEIIDPLSFYSKWKRDWKENVPFIEKSWRRPTLPFKETVSSLEERNNYAQKNAKESLLPVDTMPNKARWFRDFSESVSMVEKEYAEYISCYKEMCSVLSQMVRKGNGVFYDILFSEGPMDIDEFKDKSGVPSGYSPFVDFRVGDYEYREALYRFVMQKQDIDVNPLLSNLSVHVDIPDTEDRGTADVSGEDTRIYYSKHFYNAPEVVATVIGGTTSGGISIPIILSTDKSDDAGRYFEIELRSQDGTIASGKISWTARGY